jgi:hypothetical protein
VLLQNLLNQLLTVDLPAMMVLPERLEISVPGLCVLAGLKPDEGCPNHVAFCTDIWTQTNCCQLNLTNSFS